MSDRERLHPDEERAARHVRELSGVTADAAFQERLRHQFVEGAISDPAPSGAPARRPVRRASWWRWMVPALAAALVVVLVLVNRPPAFVVIASTGGALAEGVEVRSGAMLQLSDDARVDLQSGDVLLVEVTPGTRMTVPSAPGLFSRAASCTLMTGEIRLKTGAGFHGSTLRVYTPHGLAEITGTIVSVQCDENATCVCVLEGTAHVGINDADLQPVEPEFRKVMHRGGEREIVPIAGPHREGLVDFNSRVGGRLPSRD